MARRPKRGQTLSVFALSMLVVTLMVLLTLALGMRIKEKIELQNIADTAAYSQSVATARTFNVMAVLNRTEISLLVASLGTQSLISWSSAMFAGLAAAGQGLGDAASDASSQASQISLNGGDPTDCNNAAAAAGAAAGNLSAKLTQLIAQFPALDTAAGANTRAINSAEAMMQDTDFPQNYQTLYDSIVTGQQLTKQIILTAQAGQKFSGEITAAPQAEAINLREVEYLKPGGAACWEMPPSTCSIDWSHSFEIGFATRGFEFVTGRQSGNGAISSQLNSSATSGPNTVNGSVTITYTGGGSGYFQDNDGEAGVHANQPPLTGAARWADDHGQMTITAGSGSCSGSGSASVEAFVKANVESKDTDRHWWHANGADGPLSPDTPGSVAKTRHDLIGPIGQGNWPIVIDFNDVTAGKGKSDAWAQPKNYAVLVRDYTNRHQWPAADADPWVRDLNFHYISGERFDSRGTTTHNHPLTNEPITDLTKQVVIATGIAYYHRSPHFREPPNFFNPYWRATLIKPDIDGSADIATVLGVSGTAVQAYNQLDGAGFKGWQ